jgi:hypothetical protein
VRHTPHLDVYVQRTWLAAFDAFFEYLPNGFALEPCTDIESDIVLPRIGIRVPVTFRPITLIRGSPGFLRVATATGIMEVSLVERQTGFPASTARISQSPSPLVPLAQTPALVGENSDATASLDMTPFVEMLGQSMRLIDATDPQLARAIRTTINWYVPIVTTNLAAHGSYTRPDLIGVIYLSPALDYVLAEAVVHEFYHSVLHIVMVTEHILDMGLDDKFYSPWLRGGTIHGRFTDFFTPSMLLPAWRDSMLRPKRSWRPEISGYWRSGNVRSFTIGFVQLSFRSVENISRMLEDIYLKRFVVI